MLGAAILLVIVSIAAQEAHPDPQGGRMVPWRVERDLLRFKAVATDNVMKLLAIRPGMTLLDIGAGTGQFAYEFARLLKGTGEVYATDTNAYCIDYMKEEAERMGLGNLHPVLVRKDGLDGFYGKHRYDLIAIFHMYMAYEENIDYFRELRGFLAEGGRLVLILYKIPAPFSPGDFEGDLREFLKELSREPPESPYYRILKDSTRKRILDGADQAPPEDLRNAIAEDFNALLSDTRFLANFPAGSAHGNNMRFLREEQRYLDWLLVPFRRGGGVKREISIQNISGLRVFATINKLILVQKYRRYLKKDGLFTSGFTPPVKAAFEKAGYRVEAAYGDLIPFEDMVVLVSRRPSSQGPPSGFP